MTLVHYSVNYLERYLREPRADSLATSLSGYHYTRMYEMHQHTLSPHNSPIYDWVKLLSMRRIKLRGGKILKDNIDELRGFEKKKKIFFLIHFFLRSLFLNGKLKNRE